ncbi:MAG: NifU family protein [Candidatus Omnitrophica bacterium]|nr:NifU family protein [Candidatus Omnitrophota bacterium]
MDIQLMIQGTPNPNALKFVVNTPVKTQGNFTYKRADDFQHNPMAERIFEINDSIKEVYFFDNYITVTQDGLADWDDLEEKIQDIIKNNIANHDPNFETPQPKQSVPVSGATHSPEVRQINAILDETVRPALQMDGGDIQVVDYTNNVVRVFYQGACGSCPSATMGTMKAIENILRDQFNPEVMVELAETF